MTVFDKVWHLQIQDLPWCTSDMVSGVDVLL